MDHYVKIRRHEGQYIVFCIPAKLPAAGGNLLSHTFQEKEALTVFLRQTLHIPHACIEKALQRGDSIRVSVEQVERWSF
jgi:hypothetical protein